MAGWIENSFSGLAKTDDMNCERSEICKAIQLQHTVQLTEDNCVITHASNPGEVPADIPTQNKNGFSERITNSVQAKPWQGECTKISQPSSLLPLPDHSTHVIVTMNNNQDPTKSLTNNQPSLDDSATCIPNQMASNSPVKRKSTLTKLKSKFQAPRNWEMQELRKLGSLTKKDYHVNVFAVVNYLSLPKQSKGSDMFIKFGLVDETLYKNDQCLKCLCFQTCEEDMPVITSVGDIIKLPLRISVYLGELQGRTMDGQFPWMTFDGRPDALIVPRYSRSSTPTFTETDKKNVEELKSWAVSVGITRPGFCTFSELIDNLYFDCLCQVLNVDNKENVLYVWDGTKPIFTELCSNVPDNFCNASKWGETVAGKCVMVRIFGCDLKTSKIKPGQYILIPSLHFKFKEVSSRYEGSGVNKVPILALYDRILCKRQIDILHDDCSIVKKLKQRMSKLSVLPTQELPHFNNVPVKENLAPSTEIDLFKPRIQGKKKEDAARVIKTLHVSGNFTCDGNGSEAKKPRRGTFDPTVSGQVTIRHSTADETKIVSDVSRNVHSDTSPGIKSNQADEVLHVAKPSDQAIRKKRLYTIRDVKNEGVAGKFRCLATLQYVVPTKPEQFVIYICRSCKQRYELHDVTNMDDKLDLNIEVKCVNPNCNASLSLSIQFSVILNDDTGLLDVAVSDKVARTILPHINPLKLLTDKKIQEDIAHFFSTLIRERNYIEFEIKRLILHPEGKAVCSLMNWNGVTPQVMGKNLS